MVSCIFVWIIQFARHRRALNRRIHLPDLSRSIQSSYLAPLFQEDTKTSICQIIQLHRTYIWKELERIDVVIFAKKNLMW